MTNIFIRCSSPGLFAGGVKEIRRVHCIGSLQQFLPSLFFVQSFSHLYNLINLELCLVRHEPISMTNIFIRCSSPGLFAGGIKKIRRVYCIGSLQQFLQCLFFKQHLVIFYNLINLDLCLVRHEAISKTNILIWCSAPGLFAGGLKEIRRVYCIGSLQQFCKVCYLSNY